MPCVTVAVVDHVARLARLTLTDEERELFARQLDEVLAYAESIQALDTDGVPPMRHATGDQTLREDKVGPELPREQVVRAAREFIASQRYHMDMENRDFLPLAQEVLRAGDLERLDSELFAKQDPLQEEGAEARFANLRGALLAGERD